MAQATNSTHALSEQASALQKPDLEGYFRRIGFSGRPAPTLDTLQAIHALHPQAIPFENLNPLLGIPVQLELEPLQEKLLRQRRGGYCFEQNLLLSHVLTALGFRVKGLAARVLWNQPPGVIPARGHMLLLVDVQGESFIADVGFGGLTLTSPLQLRADIQQTTPHESFRLLNIGEEWVLQASVHQEWRSLYQFSLQQQLLPDYQVSSWYLCHHPDSHFTKSLIAARVTPEGRYGLRNNQLTLHDRQGNTQRHVLETATQLRTTLENVFGLTLPQVPTLDSALQKISDLPKS